MTDERIQGLLLVLIILFALLAVSLGSPDQPPPDDSRFDDSDY